MNKLFSIISHFSCFIYGSYVSLITSIFLNNFQLIFCKMASAQPISHLKDPAGRYSVIPMWIRLQCIFNTMFYAQVWNYKLRRCLFTLLGHLDYIRTTFFHHVSSGQDHPYMSMKLCVSMSTLAVLDSLSLCAGLPLDSECFR